MAIFMLDGKLVCSNRDLRPVYPSAKAIGLGYSGRCSCVPVISTSGDGVETLCIKRPTQ
jgi:hypothetical protein